MYNVLVVDDEPAMVNAMRRVIARIPRNWLDEGCQVTGVSDPGDALERLDGDAPYAVVIADLRMPAINGIELLRRAREAQPDAVRIIMSGHGDFPAVLAAINDTQVFRFLPKPWKDDEMQRAVVQAIRTGELQRENEQLAAKARARAGSVSNHDTDLRKLEAEYPGITHVDRDESGAICLDAGDLN
ncbi:MAG TPA: response regulator [Rhodanobacteraceae bacterium]